MKVLIYFPLILVISICFILSSCNFNKAAETKATEVESDDFTDETEGTIYKWETGLITSSPFINKVGEAMPEFDETYFLCSKGEYFIKFMDCENTNANAKDFVNKYVKMKVSIEDGLWDTNNPNIQSRVGEYIIYDSIIEIDTPQKIVYNDGNANSYLITNESFVYKPVKPIESSSGTYSGGGAKDFEISVDDFNLIFVKANAILNNDEIKIENRQMGTGFLKITFQDSDIKANIKNCDELDKFQDFLDGFGKK